MLFVAEPLEQRLLFSTVTLTVTSTADKGPGTLRYLINQINNSSSANVYDIQFAIPGSGVQTINVKSALPTIANSVIIDGTTQEGYGGTPLICLGGLFAGTGASGLVLTKPSTVKGLDIKQFSGNGILIQNNSGSTIEQDFIGVSPAGTAARANSGSGIVLLDSSNCTIKQNVISGNTLNGIRLASGSSGNVISGNDIGLDVTGVNAVPNGGNGIALNSASGNVTGIVTAPNLIAFNAGDGVLVTAGSSNDPIRFNSIFSNGGLGIALIGGNNGATFPSLTYSSTANGTTAVGGAINAGANTVYRLQFFIATPDDSGAGQGRQLIGTTSVTTNGSGVGNFMLALAHQSTAGTMLTATATNPTGNTSQFATNLSITSAVFPTADEEYLLALTNRARANPAAEAARYGIDLNEGLPAGTITTAPKQPLAMNPFLVIGAEGHNQWMFSSQTFAHDGPNGETPDQRMTAAGYVFSGSSYGWAENLAEEGFSGSFNADAVTADEHMQLFVDSTEPGRGHRVNIEDPDQMEIGIAITSGTFDSYNALMATEDFAYKQENNFFTGIAYTDANHNNFYDPGEGIGGVTVTATNVSGGASYSVVTWASGGYSLEVPPGTYNVVASGGSLGGTVTDSNVVIGSQNVELDFTPAQVPLITTKIAIAAVSFSQTAIVEDDSMVRNSSINSVLS